MTTQATASLRPELAQCGDLTDIRRLLTACELPQEDLTPEHLALFRVLRADRNLAGVVGLERHGACGLVRSLAVAPRYRDRGGGGMLLAAVEHLARAHGLRDLYLLTLSAQRYFSARGYRVVSRAAVPLSLRSSSEFGVLCPQTAICMHKQL